MEQLLSSLKEHLAIVGLAKNVGKTTTLQWVLEEASSQGVRVGLVSIGVDGELQDVWDYHQKPAINIEQGMWAVSAKAALQDCTARFRIQDELKASSPLGPVYLLECIQSGTVKLAGTHLMKDIQQAKTKFKQAGVELTLIDGAYDRLAAAEESVAESFILCTGVALEPRLERALALTEEIILKWQLPPWTEHLAVLDSKISYLREGQWQAIDAASLFNSLEELRLIAAAGVEAIYVPGALTEWVLKRFIGIKKPFAWVIEDPTKLFLSKETIMRWYRAGGAFYIKRKSSLVALAVSPFAPQGKEQDADEWLYAMKQMVGELPVIDALRRKVLR